MTAPTADTSQPSRPIATVRVSRAIAVRTIVVSVVAFFASAYGFGHLRAAVRGESFEPIVVPATAPPDAIGWLVATLGLIVLVVAPHELVHGLFMARYGGSRTYGVGVSRFLLPYAYAAADGASYSRNQVLVVVLAPLVGITAVGVLAMAIVPSTLLVVALAVNVAGSIGDCWMAGVLCRYPADVRITALPDGDGRGFGIYGPTEARDERLSEPSALSRFVLGVVAATVLIAGALLVLVFYSLTVGDGDVVLAGDGWLLFRHERQPGGSVHLALGARLLAAVAIAGGLVQVAIDRLWRALG
ncbi:DUF3267 domain-containing protein [Halosolutus gelatinilyticus]|uniref:DUF3267 domain-containing protein n=1 Tax=Halosolutus gelatinilyticus TaxID=2931975 RepID=UPI001FF58770|nr:DUF3267 domain-containing protein [Halosolutus gelatinilyticus]